MVQFDPGTGPASPGAGLVQGTDGNFYGTTTVPATVFRMTPDGTLTNLCFFRTNGSSPNSVLFQGADGNFYGTTEGGGTNNLGTVFQVTPSGSLTSLYSFSGADGASPASGVVQGCDGNFYGTTPYGGIGGNGTVFKLTTNGTFTTLILFDGTNGSDPGNLVWSRDGDIYGTTQYGGANGKGTIFRMSTNGTFTNLISFTGSSDGANPQATLLQGADGNIYGTTGHFGGTNANGDHIGTLFRMTIDGVLTTAATFTFTTNLNLFSSAPDKGLVEGSDGNFYGVAQNNGSNNGRLLQVTPSGGITILITLNGTNGKQPRGLMQGMDGNFYGVTAAGGSHSVGTIYRLSVPMPPVFKTVAQTNDLLTFTFSTVAGQMYQVQYNTDLTSTNWNNLGSSSIATNGTMCASDSIGPDSQRFYRVVLLP